jgi:hypothetical protein
VDREVSVRVVQESGLAGTDEPRRMFDTPV